MIQSITTNYVSTYTVPGSLDSIDMFTDCNIYFWGRLEGSKFHLSDILNSQYIGIGEEIDPSQKNAHMNISYLGKIVKSSHELKNFYEFSTKNANDSIEIINSNILPNAVKDAFYRQVDSFHLRNSKGEIKSNTPHDWSCILVEKKSIIKTNDKLSFYPSKTIVPYPLNYSYVEEKYIANELLVDQHHLFDSYYLNLKEKYIQNMENGAMESIGDKYWYPIGNILIYASRSLNKSLTIIKGDNDWLLGGKKVDDFKDILRRVMRALGSGHTISISELQRPSGSYQFQIVPQKIIKD